MIVIGSDPHKRSHTCTAVGAGTGEVGLNVLKCSPGALECLSNLGELHPGAALKTLQKPLQQILDAGVAEEGNVMAGSSI